MKSVIIKLNYLTIEQLIALIDEPYRSICYRILQDNRALFESVPGSTYNHQTWVGGYIDHVTDGMNYACKLYAMTDAIRALPFSLSDVLLIFFLHDLEKPWRILVGEDGQVSNRKGLTTKMQFRQFREDKLKEYGLHLTPEQYNALTYVEGEGKDYRSGERVMGPLAAFCHMIDSWCARGWYDHPKAINDEWPGATRVRTFS